MKAYWSSGLDLKLEQKKQPPVNTSVLFCFVFNGKRSLARVFFRLTSVLQSVDTGVNITCKDYRTHCSFGRKEKKTQDNKNEEKKKFCCRRNK